jgi:FAD/FMN-containing dehydrogenase
VQLPVAALYADVGGGAAAIAHTYASGVVPAALEFLDAGALAAAARSFPQSVPPEADFMVIVEADGTAAEAAAARGELVEALTGDALLIVAPETRADVDALWHWREGLSFAVTAVRGGKVSEDIVVPVERLDRMGCPAPRS